MMLYGRFLLFSSATVEHVPRVNNSISTFSHLPNPDHMAHLVEDDTLESVIFLHGADVVDVKVHDAFETNLRWEGRFAS